MDNKRTGKPRNIKSDLAGNRQLLLLVTDTCIRLEQDPQKRVQLLSAKAMLDGTSTDTGWVDTGSEDRSNEGREASDGQA